jgi:hypothetical protein
LKLHANIEIKREYFSIDTCYDVSKKTRKERFFFRILLKFNVFKTQGGSEKEGLFGSAKSGSLT